MLNGAGTLDFGNRVNLLRLDLYGRRDFPRLAEVARRARAQTLGGHSTLAFFPRHILRTEGSRFGMGEPREVAQSHVQAVEGRLGLLRLRRHEG